MIPLLPVDRLKRFFRLEEASGIVLMLATAFALVVANSPLVETYNYVLEDLHIAHWINDGLMAIFFLVVGMEIKRELMEGALSSFKAALTPFIAAVAGVAVPAAIFYFINKDYPGNYSGWAIPTATDIAFSLGLLALIGSNAPTYLKIVLTAIAIIDDLAAILIIGIFYTSDLNLDFLGLAAGAVAFMMLMNKLGIRHFFAYITIGFFTWFALLNSGVHATMAGVATAFCVPMHRKTDEDYTLLDKLIHNFHPWTAFLILPIFAFANAGLSFDGLTRDHFTAPLTLGIIAGLVAGKAVGITSVLCLFRPEGLRFLHILGLGFLCGIGFTMSLFIGELAFETDNAHNEIKIGVMIASVLSGFLAFICLKSAGRIYSDQQSQPT